MNGAIFFSGQYGSTAQYADWISEATGLPMFAVNDANADPSKFDYLILGSSVIVYKLSIRKWARANLASIENKPTILFTVSGAPAGAKLDGWIAGSLPESLTSKMKHVALRGRLRPAELNWWVRLILRIGAWKNDDPEAKKEELLGFDYMDKSSIKPILELVQQIQSSEATPS
ncbi:MAG: flavodoxin domain-containing protein [Arenicellales bacterium]